MAPSTGPPLSPHSPESVSWRIHRENALLLAGGRALLLQLAHPGVAAGVAEHSDFRSRPLRRLFRTLDLWFGLTFGDPQHVHRAAHAINTTHQRVRGQGYRASDPRLLLWVHATLMESSLVAFEQFVRPLQPAEREAYYEEAKSLGALLGVQHDRYPPRFADFQRYWDGMLAGDELQVDDRARDLARAVLWPRIGVVPGALWHPVAALTAGLLPERLREAYALPWGRFERGLFAAERHLFAALCPRLPAPLRYMVPAQRAERKAAGVSR